MAFCGTCGTNISDASFCTQCGTSVKQSNLPPTPIVVTPSTPTEQIILKEGDVFVSQSRFISGTETFTISGVTSIGSEVEVPSKKGPILAMLFGAFWALAGLILIAKGGIIVMIFGGVVFALGLMVFKKRVPVHVVVLRSASSQQKTKKSPDSAFIQRIIAALNQAVILRG